MFIVEYREKLRHSANRQNLIEQTEAQCQTLAEHGQKMIVKWRKIEKPGPAVQDQIWEFLYNYAKCATTQVMLHGNVELLDMGATKSMMMELISMLYPPVDYVTEVFNRIVFIAERATETVKPGDHDRFSPLDTMSVFRRMLGCHLWGKDEIAGKLKRCREDYAAKIRRDLHHVEFEQSRYDRWEMRYLECERRYHQILNQIGESVRPAAPAIYSPRSPWELRTLVKELPESLRPPVRTSPYQYKWTDYLRLRKVMSGKAGMPHLLFPEETSADIKHISPRK